MMKVILLIKMYFYTLLVKYGELQSSFLPVIIDIIHIEVFWLTVQNKRMKVQCHW